MGGVFVPEYGRAKEGVKEQLELQWNGESVHIKKSEWNWKSKESGREETRGSVRKNARSKLAARCLMR